MFSIYRKEVTPVPMMYRIDEPKPTPEIHVEANLSCPSCGKETHIQIEYNLRTRGLKIVGYDLKNAGEPPVKIEIDGNTVKMECPRCKESDVVADNLFIIPLLWWIKLHNYRGGLTAEQETMLKQLMGTTEVREFLERENIQKPF